MPKKTKKQIENILFEPYGKKISLKTKQDLRELKEMGIINGFKVLIFEITFFTGLFLFFLQLEIFSYISNKIGSFRLDIFMCLMIVMNIIGYILILKRVSPNRKKQKDLKIEIEKREGLTTREILRKK